MEFKIPNNLSFDGNMKENFKKFKQEFEIYMQASEKDKKSDEVQVAILLNIIGPEALEKYNTFELTDDKKKDPKEVMKAFEEYCIPISNESVDRHVFFARVQGTTESFDEYFTALKKLSMSCDFGALKDSLIKDRIISGITNSQLKDRLLREEKLTLEKCIRMCKASEITSAQMKTLSEENKIQAVKVYKKNDYGTRNNEKQFNKSRQQHNNTHAIGRQNTHACGRCGKSHAKFQCPAFNKVCRQCNKKNHFAKMCRFKRTVNYVDEKSSEEHEEEECVLGSIESQKPCKDWYERLKVNNSEYLKVKLDTGAQCNVLPNHIFKKLNMNEKTLKESKMCLSNYNGSKIDVIGKCSLFCETAKGTKDEIEFEIVNCNYNVPAVLGLPTLIELNLVQRIDLIETPIPELLGNYKDLFSGLGNINGFNYEIKLKPGAVGKIEPCRKVPINLIDSLKTELVKMEQLKVIEKIDEPTEFVNSLVIVRKPNGSLRICLDPQYLNSNILREHYYLPTFAEIASRMNGAKVFSILDANKAFWQIKLTEDSSKLTTFNTPFGRYCFLRLPYGISSAPEVFHRSFNEIFGNIEGVEIFIDDLLIWGKDVEEHNLRLNKVLEKARKRNVHFNLEKCKIGVSSVKYLGHIFSEDGLMPDEDKIKAIVAMKTPTNVKELGCFLGMITYVSKFVPNLSQLTSTLRDLLKKGSAWTWNSNHEKSFNDLQEILMKKPVLQYFDVKSPITLSVDSSKDGMGAVLLQNNLPVAYASKSLTETQKNYAQIEKETLAVVFGCEKFHQYIFGKQFTVESDHKPLEAIFKKGLDKCPVRLQRMRIRLQPYDFNLIYKPGKELLLADALSRSFIEDPKDFFDGDIELYVGMILESIPMSSSKLKIFQIESNEDEEMQTLIKLIMTGWPNDKKLVPDVAKPYYHFKEELSTVNGLVFKNSRVVVPKKLRTDMLYRIHYSHLGMEKCKNRARELLYWPGMSKEVEDMILNCSTCLTFQKGNTKEPLMPKEVPNGPWEVLGTDLFHFQGREHLLVIDYFSKYVETKALTELTSVETIRSLKKMFSRFGIPKILYSDNGPQYNSSKFRNFAAKWNFESRTSSPRFPQSNGMVERHLQTVKRMLTKAEHDGRDPYLTLLEYRNTPISDVIASPAELMFGRKINGLLPRKEDFILTKEFDKTREKLILRQQKQKEYHDQGARTLPPINDGDTVFINDQPKLPNQPAKVLGKADRPRSYQLQKEDGRVIERNRKHIIRGEGQEFRLNPSILLPEEEESQLDSSRQPDPASEEMSESPGSTPKRDVRPEVREQRFKRETVLDKPKYTRYGRAVNKPSYLKDYT